MPRSLIGKSAFVAFFVLVQFSGFSAVATAQATDKYQLSDSLNFLAERQSLVDGGLIEIGDSQSSDLTSAWSVIAFSAAGFDSATVDSSEENINLLNYLTDRACTYTVSTDIERTVLALSAAHYDLTEISSCNLRNSLLSLIDPVSGQIGLDTTSTVFGVLALSSINGTIPLKTVDYLRASQQPDGGWDSGWGTESNITAQAVMALVKSGVDQNDLTIIKAKNYLKNLQTSTGGIKYDNNFWTTESDSFSDSFVLQMINALGEAPDDDFWMIDGKTISDDLISLKKDDNSFIFSQTWGSLTPVWNTAIAVIALSNNQLPIESGQLVDYQTDNESNHNPVENNNNLDSNQTSTQVSPLDSTVTNNTTSQNQANDTESNAATEPQPLVVKVDQAKNVSISSGNIDSTNDDSMNLSYPSLNSEESGQVQGMSDRQQSINWFYLISLGICGLIFGIGVGYYFYQKNV